MDDHIQDALPAWRLILEGQATMTDLAHYSVFDVLDHCELLDAMRNDA